MQMTLETLGQLERRLHVAVPIEQIEGEVQKRLARLAKTVKIAGFRPGKVPLKMVTQQYGPQVRSDVISDTVQSSLNDAIRAQNLRVAGYPRIEPKQPAAEDQFEFSAVFEVYPEIALGDLSGVEIMRPVRTLGEIRGNATFRLAASTGSRVTTWVEVSAMKLIAKRAAQRLSRRSWIVNTVGKRHNRVTAKGRNTMPSRPS